MVLMFPRYDRGVTNFKIHPLKKMAGHWGKKKEFFGKTEKMKAIDLLIKNYASPQRNKGPPKHYP